MGKYLGAVGWLFVAISFALHFVYSADIAAHARSFVAVDRFIDLLFVVLSLSWAYVALKGGKDE